MNKEKNHLKKLKIIFESVIKLIEEYKPNEISVESTFFGKNVQSMLKLGRAQGVAMLAGEINGIKINEFTFRSVQSRSKNLNVGDTINLKPKKGQVHIFNKNGEVIRNE